jgi:hypothetical protein
MEKVLNENYLKIILKQSSSVNEFFLKEIKARKFQQAYQESHFVILPSAMKAGLKYCRRYVLGCVSLATKVSCIPLC